MIEANIRTKVNGMQTDMNAIVKASVESEIIDYARQNGASKNK